MRLGRETKPLTELASGFDALYMTAECVLPKLFLADLKAAQDRARDEGSPSPLELGPETFLVGERGINRYRYALHHPNGLIALTQSKNLPAVSIQPRARFIHAVGVEPATRWFSELVESIVGPVRWKASRADLFMDSHGWDLTGNDRERFLCRAKDLRTWESHSALTGLGFGSGKTLSARIYDKTEEMRAKGSDWWPDVWGADYLSSERVLRVEFQLRRSVIREVGLDSPEDVLREAPRVWAYLTDEWLTFRDPSGDKTRSRWPVSPAWTSVQAASLRAEAVGLERVSAGERAGSIRRLLPQLQGYLSSAGALLNATTREETLHRVGRLLEAEAERTGISFEQRLAGKRADLRAVGA
ncbi:hypothetical protein IDH50_15905 [Aeromicrobium tamlense]|uniref:Replication initiation factor n=1 Tax=Aeromicrobium tamlense TaxID=375541 RepID=A0A8I0G2K7_9ACTN|nr:hypothetical protein [Aeromicrobium tamlense]MBD1271729.1 hypothetical protein [Aeromicrobium tamlense]NYI37523.1 hypothetical protein [Aeromicrobium tamlense]